MRLILTNARIVADGDAFDGCLAVEDGVVAEIRREAFSGSGPEVLDCGGKLILPGAVDVHVHANDPGNTAREDFATLTAAAAAGGVTTVVDMPMDTLPPPVDGASFLSKLRIAEEKPLVDFALWGGLVEDNSDCLDAMARAGAAGFKAFMVHADDDFPRVTDGTLRKDLARAAALGLPVLVHAEDNDAALAGERECRAAGRESAADLLRARSVEVENTAVRRALDLASRTRAAVHICHASNPGAVSLVAEARADGVRATVETCMHYLLFDGDDFLRDPNALKCLPPLRSRDAQTGLWNQLLRGGIDIIASDHSPCEPGEKDPGLGIWDAWGGINGVQATLQLLFSEGVAKRGMSLRRFTEVTAANPARLAGLHPRKGSLRVGADADLVLLDPAARWRWTSENWFSKHPNTPYLGMSGTGAVAATMVRGKFVFRDGRLCGRPGWGRALRREGAL